MPETAWNDAERRRYARQLALPELGSAGQARLRRGSILLVGVGGLGSPAALYLAAAGVGRIGLVDYDAVDASNLQRQILFATTDVGRPKLSAARDRLLALNPHIDVECIDAPFAADNAMQLVETADVVIDGSDNFPTRYLVNDACVLAGTPNVFGSIQGFEGQAAVFAAGGGPCYRCLHPEPPPDGLIPSCAEAGVLGVLPGVIGAIQATEAVKILAGLGEPLIGRFLIYDALRMRMRTIVLPRDSGCAICGDAPTIRTLAAYDRACEADDPPVEIGVAELRAWRASGRPHQLIDVREPGEHAVAAIEGARLVPLGRLSDVAAGLARDRPVVVHCRMGGRSARAARLLRRFGVDARSLTGGIEAWIRAIDEPVEP